MATFAQLVHARARRSAAARPLDLSVIETQVVRLFGLVADGVAAATSALLNEDLAAGSSLAAADAQIDALRLEVEEMVRSELLDIATRAPREVQLLLAAFRIVPELERSGDLVEHIALRAGLGLMLPLSPRARGLTDQMGRTAAEMWQIAARAYAVKDATAAARLREFDDALDDLHVSLTDELSAGQLPTSVAIELGLVARFFERLGDHAVNVTRRLVLDLVDDQRDGG
jgi:phosphate transport system protein